MLALFALGVAGASPHILSILQDDLGWYDSGIHNPEAVAWSPNISKIAAAGIVLAVDESGLVGVSCCSSGSSGSGAAAVARCRHHHRRQVVVRERVPPVWTDAATVGGSDTRLAAPSRGSHSTRQHVVVGIHVRTCQVTTANQQPTVTQTTTGLYKRFADDGMAK